MPETMIERMARAMHDYACTPYGSSSPMPESWGVQGFLYRNMAIVALEAIKEPSETIEDQLAEGIIQAGEQVPCGLADGWRLSIQAILDGK